MQVSLAYVAPGAQEWQELEVADDATAMSVIEQSGILGRHPEIDLSRQKIGIYGRLVTLATGLSAGDRVEIYRPLANLDDDDDE